MENLSKVLNRSLHQETKAGGGDLNNSVIMVKRHVGCSLLEMEIHFHKPEWLKH